MSALFSMTAFAGEWKQNETGWWYQQEDGTYPAGQWMTIGDQQYYFGDDGYVCTGWLEAESGEWYYLDPSGELRYEDLEENGVVYSFNETGMCINPHEATYVPDFDSDYE